MSHIAVPVDCHQRGYPLQRCQQPYAVSISVSFVSVHQRSSADARTFPRRSRTVPSTRVQITIVLKIGRLAVRPRPWPPPLISVNDSLLDLLLRVPSQLSASAILYRSRPKWSTFESLPAAISILHRISAVRDAQAGNPSSKPTPSTSRSCPMLSLTANADFVSSAPVVGAAMPAQADCDELGAVSSCLDTQHSQCPIDGVVAGSGKGLTVA